MVTMLDKVNEQPVRILHTGIGPATAMFFICVKQFTEAKGMTRLSLAIDAMWRSPTCEG
jgi:hypothetical protein